jgi:hypothetical protein
VTVLATQCEIDILASRIEQAYHRLRPGWKGTCSTQRVWIVAAMKLHQVHQEDHSIPVDPELFVASQPRNSMFPDPWVELTRAESLKLYRKRIREIIRALRNELEGEVKLAEERIHTGEAVSKILLSRNRRLSPLGRLIVAQRAGRFSLAKRFILGALEQHKACPLYRQASLGMLAGDLYPVPEATAPAFHPSLHTGIRSRAQVHLN